MQLTPDQRARLGRELRRARRDAGYRTLIDLDRRIGISAKTLGNAEAGSRVSDDTLWAFEKAVGWPPGTVERVGLGGDPPSPGSVDPVGADLTLVHDDELLAEMNRRLAERRRLLDQAGLTVLSQGRTTFTADVTVGQPALPDADVPVPDFDLLAARRGVPDTRAADAQDVETEAPDVEGPDGGA